MSSEHPPVSGSHQVLQRLAEQLGACSHELAKIAQQIAKLRDRLEQIERSTQAKPEGTAEV